MGRAVTIGYKWGKRMSVRKVHEIVSATLAFTAEARVYRDTDNEEYQTRLYINGEEREGARYFTDDKVDAIQSGERMVYIACKQ